MTNLNPKISWTILIIILIIVFGVVGYSGYNYYNDLSKTSGTVSTPIATPTNTSTSTLPIASTTSPTPTTTTTDPTANWKTYTNSNYKFSFKYPNDWTKLDDNVQDDFINVILKKDTTNPLIVRVYFGKNDGHGGATYFDATRNAQRTYPAGIADEFVFPNGNGYGPTDPYITERFVKNSIVYAFEFYGDAKLSDQENSVVESLQFTK